MKTIESISFEGKKALIRVDFNVPLNNQLEIIDATRIQAAKPTIIKVLSEKGSVILMSHLGRPKGEIKNALSFKNIVNYISEELGIQVKFVSNCIGEEVEQAVEELEKGEVLLLENLRFHKEEIAGNIQFAKKLAKIGDIYINDAFGTAHRAHASTSVIAQFFEEKYFGLLLEKELIAIDKIFKTGKKPITAIIGGAKVSSKITIIENILPVIDKLIIGGGMLFTFVKAQGGKIGDSLVEDDKLDLALEILKKAKTHNVEVIIPTDVIAADAFDNEANIQEVPSNEIPDGWMGLDVGPITNSIIEKVIASSKTILWNGPMGVFELPSFSKGTQVLGNAIAEATEKGAFSLVGGGDSVAAAIQMGLKNKVSYISTGGGAMLESLEGKTLPAVAAIEA